MHAACVVCIAAASTCVTPQVLQVAVTCNLVLNRFNLQPTTAGADPDVDGVGSHHDVEDHLDAAASSQQQQQQPQVVTG
jgi:hypothetical protein